jgi:NAD(P)-dependent dehydrogenase (short-subunit alcohol dehydrogenase family)
VASRSLDGRVVLVTGASRGIGYEAALEAGRRGAHVIALARTVGGLEALDDAIKSAGGSATLVPLDLRDFEALDRLGLSIFERWKKLDGLVANAAVLGPLSPLGHIDPKDFERTFAINVTANYRLIRSLDALFRQSDAGRAVFLTSGAARNGRAYWGLYAATKAALETLVRAYAAELASTPVRANVFNPGRLRTAMHAEAFPGVDPNGFQPPSAAASALIDMIEPGYSQNGMLFKFSSGETVSL